MHGPLIDAPPTVGDLRPVVSAGALTAAECDFLIEERRIQAVTAPVPAPRGHNVYFGGLSEALREHLGLPEPGTGDFVPSMLRLLQIMARWNAEAFGFELADPLLPVGRLVRDDEEFTDCTAWANDYQVLADGRLTPKLTGFVPLTDPDEYDGGGLEIFTGARTITASRQRGALTLWPSWMPTRRYAVTSGECVSLKIQAHGPAFR